MYHFYISYILCIIIISSVLSLPGITPKIRTLILALYATVLFHPTLKMTHTKNFVCAIFSRGSSVFFLLVSPLAYNLAYLIIDSIAIIASRPYGMVSYALLIFYCFCCSYQCYGVLVKKLEKCKSLEPEYKRINFWKTTLNFNEVKT